MISIQNTATEYPARTEPRTWGIEIFINGLSQCASDYIITDNDDEESITKEVTDAIEAIMARRGINSAYGGTGQ